MHSSRAILHEGLDLQMMHSLKVGQVRRDRRQNRGIKFNLGVRADFLEEVTFPLSCGDGRGLPCSWGGGRIMIKVVKFSLDVLIPEDGALPPTVSFSPDARRSTLRSYGRSSAAPRLASWPLGLSGLHILHLRNKQLDYL